MLLSFELIYFGDCKDMIQFYVNIFDNSTAEIRTYAEMPAADILGIKEPDMVWRASLSIRYGSHAVKFKLSDSLLIARQEEVGYKGQSYNPLICIEHPDEQYVRGLFEKLYGGKYSFDEIQKGIHSDQYGMRWVYRKSSQCNIYHCLEFKGNCREVAEYVKNAYQADLTKLVTYADSPHASEISPDAKDKIYGALMEFQGEDYSCAIKYSDSLESAIHNYNGYGSDDKLWYQIIIAVEDPDETHLRESFEKLSVGATLNRPVSPNEDGCLYGSLIDQYGFVWEVFGC